MGFALSDVWQYYGQVPSSSRASNSTLAVSMSIAHADDLNSSPHLHPHSTQILDVTVD